ncbi:MAG: hypothetical protein HND52_20705 [Ignavibacteriae bacterium]|nr:hypothetical protein [Ignavibacteriota bacterium]NOH00393.1 hypothetical protein [Ignavibacteriota bacterium]
MTHCDCCERQLDDDDIQWAFDNPLCDDCFSETYTYCVSCDCTLGRDEAYYENDDPYCYNCYEDNTDSHAPNDPPVDDTDRELIIHLSNNWLAGKSNFKYPLKINHNDFQLPELKSKTGLIDKSIYVYGLVDRDEYQLRATTDLFNLISQYVTLNNWDVKLTNEATGIGRLGISRELRENRADELVEMLHSIINQTDPTTK